MATINVTIINRFVYVAISSMIYFLCFWVILVMLLIIYLLSILLLD